MLAAVFGREASVRLLLERGADASARNIEGQSALEFALKHDHQELLPILREAAAKSERLPGRERFEDRDHEPPASKIAGRKPRRLSAATGTGRGQRRRKSRGVLEKWLGVYRFDPANTSRLIADSFKERFVMKADYDQALAAFLSEEDPEVDQIRLLIDEDAIRLTNDIASERFPITRCWNDGGKEFVEVTWEGRPERFEIQEFEGGCLRLYNPSNSLSENVWRPVAVSGADV
jgi:hypothetical protein